MISKTQLKYIQSLGQKKPRDVDNVFVAEGPKLVKELLQAKNCKVKKVYALADWITKNGDPYDFVEEITDHELKKISQLATPNAVLLIAEKINWEEKIELKGNISLILDTIQDPGNLGTIIRLADWFGVKNIICNQETADCYNPKVIQASMGSITRVRVEYTGIENFIRDNNNIRVYATVLDGRDITKMDKIDEGLFIVGNESKGISEEILKLANVRITIPKKGKAESLNAAIATGIILSHICK